MKKKLPVSKNRERNIDRGCNWETHEHCLICGSPVDTTKTHKRLWLINGGNQIATTDETEEESLDVGCHVVGNGCIRKHKLQKFAITWEGSRC